MPIKLQPPRKGKTPYWSGRGTYLGVYTNRTTKALTRRAAAKVVARWKAEIERGEFSQPGDPTFLSASLAYLQNGGESTFLEPIIEHFGDTILPKIDQAAMDAGAAKLYPDASPATRNRQFYTPVAAILHHAGVPITVRRPKGSEGKQRTDWLWPEQAFRLFKAAKDLEFRAFLMLLCYTGARLSEALNMTCADVRLSEGSAYIGMTKTGTPRSAFLPANVVAELKRHPRGVTRGTEKLFRFGKNGHLYTLLRETKTRAGADLSGVMFHTFCHTYATWMRRYAGLDTRGLLGTGRWADMKSVMRYEHVVVSEESQKADMLPVEKTWKRRLQKERKRANAR